MRIPFYQVDAFSCGPFTGNPAAICLLDFWLDDDVLQKIAQENNLSETAFYVANTGSEELNLRWFTPNTEVVLCGHATLATGAVLFELEKIQGQCVGFSTRSGHLSVVSEGNCYKLNLPIEQAVRIDVPDGLLAALGLIASDVDCVLQASDLVVVIHNEKYLDSLQPDFGLLEKISTRGVVVTSASQIGDFRSRWFGPRVGVNEDPVTGSAYTFLAPFWAERLGKTTLSAVQGGGRKGRLVCKIIENDRLELIGEGRIVIRGEFFL